MIKIHEKRLNVHFFPKLIKKHKTEAMSLNVKMQYNNVKTFLDFLMWCNTCETSHAIFPCLTLGV